MEHPQSEDPLFPLHLDLLLHMVALSVLEVLVELEVD